MWTPVKLIAGGLLIGVLMTFIAWPTSHGIALGFWSFVVFLAIALITSLSAPRQGA